MNEAEATAAGGGAISTCWSCRGPVAGDSIFCATCGAVQPPADVDHFARLDLTPTFDVDADSLDRGYFDAQRRLHPDRFATRTPRERAFSQLQAVSLNEAYETLKDPLRRADYLVTLKGGEVAPEGCSLVNEQELLHEVMERREELAEADSVAAVEALEAAASDDFGRCIAALSTAFACDDLPAAARLTTRMRYLGKYIEECRSRRTRLGRHT
ncbi:MAG: Fe-S protein assembly co-chaperone HscB [Rhodospirillales bacterium]|nr:Fe-S protein assembly co-chaperone HscB [Rhodospirillales bacterium]